MNIIIRRLKSGSTERRPDFEVTGVMESSYLEKMKIKFIFLLIEPMIQNTEEKRRKSQVLSTKWKIFFANCHKKGLRF